MFHNAHHNFGKCGIFVQLNLKRLMTLKSESVTGLMKGIEGLFKKKRWHTKCNRRAHCNYQKYARMDKKYTLDMLVWVVANERIELLPLLVLDIDAKATRTAPHRGV